MVALIYLLNLLIGEVFSDVLENPSTPAILRRSSTLIIVTAALALAVLIGRWVAERYPLIVISVGRGNGHGPGFVLLPPWRGTATGAAAHPSAGQRRALPDVRGITMKLDDCRTDTRLGASRLTAETKAVIRPDLQFLAEHRNLGDLPESARWAFRSRAATLAAVAPLLTGELDEFARAIEQALHHHSPDGSTPTNSIGGAGTDLGAQLSGADPVTGGSGYDPGSVGAGHHPGATGVQHDHSVLLHGHEELGGVALGAAFRVFADWDDLVDGQIETFDWLLRAAGDIVKRRTVATVASTVGSVLAGPAGAVIGWVFGGWVEAQRQSYSLDQADRHDDAHFEERAADVDDRYTTLTRDHDRDLEPMREILRHATTVEARRAPADAHYPEIAQWCTEIRPAVLNLVAVLHRAAISRGTPRNLRRQMMRDLRTKQDAWLNELEHAREQMSRGEASAALSVAVRIAFECANSWALLVDVDWVKAAAELQNVPVLWRSDLAQWELDARIRMQPHKATYQTKAQALHSAFLTKREQLAEERLQAYLFCVNAIRGRHNRKLLGSVPELLALIQRRRATAAA